MVSKTTKIFFIANKFKKDIFLKKHIYQVAKEVNSNQLNEYYFVMDETELRSGYSQNFHFDPQGIPIIPSYIDVEDQKLIYYPISIGQFGLAIFHTYLKTRAAEDEKRFMKIVDWFYDYRITDKNMGDYWLTDVAKPEYHISKPWPSAFSQSRGISILLRGYQRSKDKRYLDVATNALKIFDIPAANGGVTTFTEHGPLYEEYPAPFLTAVLDGLIFSLFGLFDYVRVVRENQYAKRLFDEGVEALISTLPQYDLGFWIRYNLCKEPFYPEIDPATIGYFRLVNSQLELLYRISGKAALLEWAKKWKKYDYFFNILKMYRLKYQALKKLNRL